MAEIRSAESLRGLYLRIGRGWGEANYDPAARLLNFTGFVRAWGGPGTHMTRDSLYFARILLDTRDETQVARAGGIVEAVLDTQVTRDGSPCRGNFPWCAEDPEEKVWDPNWACFNAQTLIELLRRHGSRVPPPLAARMERSLALCCEHDLARWVSPAYTNIALLTAHGLACGGDWLRDRRMAEAGRAKLQETADCVAAAGAVSEYNSPTYAGVVLRTLASLLAHVRDAESRELASGLWRRQWAELVRRMHAATGQLAGPHGRAYGRDMQRHTHGLVKFYLHRTCGPAFPLGVEADGSASDLFPALMADDPDCPLDVVALARALRLPRTERQPVDACVTPGALPAFRRHPPSWRQPGDPDKWAALTANKGRPGVPGFTGAVQSITTYLEDRFCLGTVNAETQGDQAAPLVAHWPGAESGRACYFVGLALRVQEDGALAYLPGGVLCCAQDERRVLGLLRFELDPEDRTPPAARRAALAFHVGRDAAPEVLAPGGTGDDLRLDQGAIIRAGGQLVGIRVLRARVPGARARGRLCERPAPHAHAEGEVGVHLALEPLALVEGQAAFVAFALEFAPASASGGEAALLERLRAARVAESPEGTVRLAWGSTLGLETSSRVLDCKGWLTREGMVR